jgi:transposase
MVEMSELQGKTAAELISIIKSQQEAFRKKEKNFSQENCLLKEKLQEKNTAIQTKTQHISQLQEYIVLLKQGRFGSSSERFVDTLLQGCLFNEAELEVTQAKQTTEEEANDKVTVVASHSRKKQTGTRKPLPEFLPRKQVIHDLNEADKQCACGCTLQAIGEVKTEQLEIIPAQLFVIEHIQKKYACKGCEQTVKTAKKPKQPIPKSMAGPGLLAHILSEKFEFHLPLYRQEQRLQRIGIDIPRTTLSQWVIKCAKLLQPLANLLEDEILNHDVAYADETTIQVLKEPNKKAQSKSYLWLYSGGPPERFVHVCHYHPGRQHSHAIEFFDGVKGYLHCDGYQAYDRLSEINPNIKQVGCWFHVRRKFVEAAKVGKKARHAQWFVKQIQVLAMIERRCTDQQLTSEKRQQAREEQAKPVIEAIKSKLLELKPITPATGRLGLAINYALSQWSKLETYLGDGRLEMSNNRSERAIKSFAVGRKNWLFATSVDGAKSSAVIFSLIETCKAHQINPARWLHYALAKLPACDTVESFEALLPFNCKQLLEKYSTG